MQTTRHLKESAMENQVQHLLSQRDLAKRWGKPEASINRFSNKGVGPRCIKVRGAVMYPLDEIQKFERACLFFSPADVAFSQSA